METKRSHFPCGMPHENYLFLRSEKFVQNCGEAVQKSRIESISAVFTPTSTIFMVVTRVHRAMSA